MGSDHLYEKKVKHYNEQFMDILILYLDDTPKRTRQNYTLWILTNLEVKVWTLGA